MDFFLLAGRFGRFSIRDNILSFVVKIGWILCRDWNGLFFSVFAFVFFVLTASSWSSSSSSPPSPASLDFFFFLFLLSPSSSFVFFFFLSLFTWPLFFFFFDWLARLGFLGPFLDLERSIRLSGNYSFCGSFLGFHKLAQCQDSGHWQMKRALLYMLLFLISTPCCSSIPFLPFVTSPSIPYPRGQSHPQKTSSDVVPVPPFILPLNMLTI